MRTRNEYTDAAQKAGADAEGIREGTNAIYRGIGGKPQGKRDKWPIKDQAETMVAEHFATNRIKDIPPGRVAQSEANKRVEQASYEGARNAREYIDESPKENGNWFSNVFGAIMGCDIWGNPIEPQSSSNEPDPPEPDPQTTHLTESEPEEENFIQWLFNGKDLWGN